MNGSDLADPSQTSPKTEERLLELSGQYKQATSLKDRAAVASDAVDFLYHQFLSRARAIPGDAKLAFEQRNWQRSLALSRERMTLFRILRDVAITWFTDLPENEDDAEVFWQTTYDVHTQRIAGSYQGDIAYAFLASIRRRLTRDRWRFIDYSYARATRAKRPPMAERPVIHRQFVFQGKIGTPTIERIIKVLDLQGLWRDFGGDCQKIAARINVDLDIQENHIGGRAQIIDAGFYRNRGAYIVGFIEANAQRHPLSIALLNNRHGIHVDAVTTDGDRLRYIFSSSLANFHVTNANFHEIIDFLFRLMPGRPRGLHYSTIGYNHVGKMAVMRQIEREMDATDEPFDYAPGPRGSVAIGFTAPHLSYVLKIIRNHPTDQYKWGSFPGVETVLSKYRQVHELNRAGSMLDNVMYDNVALPKDFFGSELAKELLEAASENVRLVGDRILFRHLIVQMKMRPLPEFLKTASRKDAERAISSLGRCIRNNAAANVFNKDLDGRNYGVGQTLKVYLFDYDAVEALTEVKIRTNADRVDGEEDVPDWFFEDGIVFLPEEIELHLRIHDRHLRTCFRDEHGDLLTTDFWTERQTALQQGKVPRVSTYPDVCRL